MTSHDVVITGNRVHPGVRYTIPLPVTHMSHGAIRRPRVPEPGALDYVAGQLYSQADALHSDNERDALRSVARFLRALTLDARRDA